ncbi:MAG: pyruvate, phosphate dikinase [Alphaproteobacteria bacterium]|nr:pyruvate, phosphate dikinase [Alphaproteobacteria bacterium]
MAEKYIYTFSEEKTEGNASMRNLLGGKGANLAEMCNIGIPVPPGFTMSTEVCKYYYAHDNKLPDNFAEEVNASLSKIEKILGKKFGDEKNPLLVSVRSGARSSMPGMMDTILNLGLNDKTVCGLAEYSRNERFAYDTYRRFIQMYSDVVLGIEYYHFEEIIEMVKQENDITLDTEMTTENLKSLVMKFKEIVLSKYGKEFPQNVDDQLWGAISAVFDSWMSNRAITYRKMNNIPEEWGTAVNIQSMVFGNTGNNSATGVAFTRNPSTGEKNLYGEYLINAQGEDVVAGIRTPQSITKADRLALGSEDPSMEESMPSLSKELFNISHKLENHYKDMQDIEFTIQDGKLWILQTRSGKRTAQSAMRIAVELVDEGMIDRKTAITRIDPESLNQLLHPTLDSKAVKSVLTKGLPASPGAASGVVVFSAAEAERLSGLGEKVLLTRVETSPEDIHGMYASEGIITSKGGMTSHAAVVARGMGKPCIVGASSIKIDYELQVMKVGDVSLKAGDYVTIDGESGEVILGNVPTINPVFSEFFTKIMDWANDTKSLKIRTNAETTNDITAALNFHAEGIGLCRTEHMFFENDRIIHVRDMIIAQNTEARESALKKILPMQRGDFQGIFELMKDKPVNIRLLDMPLHEFLPNKDEEMQQVAETAGIEISTVRHRCKQLHEINPMLGHRGSRLGITYPEIYKMQATAIFEAMVEVMKSGINPNVEIMIPLIATEKEMVILRELIESVKNKISISSGKKLDCQIGTMIELPRAALISHKIAEHAEYMSYGTNDLSQTTFGLSRDDSSTFIPEYTEKGIFNADPFVSLDQEGVGELIKISALRARKTRQNIKLGICGEHGGHPDSVKFFSNLDFDYVSCSPYRIPIARLAAAQAVIESAIEENTTPGKKISI